MHKKFGDTLVEVALAIGIFSLVAIVVVSVISASTSGAQTALEVTITREDLDAQAEALRFIHDSYVSGSQSRDTSQNNYYNLWKAVTEKAMDGNAVSDEIITFNPSSCSELYDQSSPGELRTGLGNPFVINTRQLGNPDNEKNIVISSGGTGSQKVFYEASTFPRILYGGRTASADSIGEDYDTQANYEGADYIKRVEGIYIIAVKDKGSTIVSGGGGNSSITIDKNKPAYYDFYIRSCWIPPGKDKPSTISTVIRLYDPAVIEY
ncbi:hypothetical protein IJ076_00215 [Candidatus Saccharibacteria bacterium]|nr:hypothetical protein [Candidatus Saccharibacteria bacterium]